MLSRANKIVRAFRKSNSCNDMVAISRQKKKPNHEAIVHSVLLSIKVFESGINHHYQLPESLLIFNHKGKLKTSICYSSVNHLIE